MKALVTGGCGFIGSHLVDSLILSGYEVTIVDNLSKGRYFWNESLIKPHLYESDIRDATSMLDIFQLAQPDLVFHLAAHHYIPYCEKNPHEAFETNVTGSLNIFNACHKTSSVKKLFFTSTGDVYAPSGYVHREIDQVSPVYVYGETKLMGEQAIRRYKSSVGVGFDVVIGRLFNAAGTHETNPHFLPEVVRQITAGANKIEVGNLWPVRDFVDVRSMASIIHRLTEKISGIDVFNIGSGIGQSVGDALKLLVESAEFDISVVSSEARKRPNDRPYLCPNVDRLIAALGAAAEPFGVETAKSIWAEPAHTRLIYA